MLLLLLACEQPAPPAPLPAPPVEAPVEAPAPPPPPPAASGVLSFRGGAHRDFSGQGTLPRAGVQVKWKVQVGCIDVWCGVGWSGQPLLVKWSEAAAAAQTFIGGKVPRIEVISAALDGKVRFIDLDTGALTRPTLQAQDAPIKGTPSLDPRVPVLYVGQGLPDTAGGFHYKGISLLDGKPQLKISSRQRTWNGKNLEPFRGWGGSDGNALVLPDLDLLLHGGENHVFYQVDLGARPWPLVDGPLLNPRVRPLAIPSGADPLTSKRAPGIESSVGFHDGVAYWSDNEGTLYGFNLAEQREVMRVQLGDDSDATGLIQVEDGRPYLYVGSEVDKQVPGRPISTTGTGRFSKVDLTTGTFVWRLEIPCWTVRGEDALHDLNGGFLASAAPGQGPSADLIFVSSAREPGIGGGRLFAIRRQAGPDGKPEVVWTGKLQGFAWSSPITDGKTVIAGDSSGFLTAFDAVTGAMLWQKEMGGTVESSPVFWDDTVVVGVRGGFVMALTEAAPTTPTAAPATTPATKAPSQ